jgi:AcrR family transcriptional regulator
VPASDTRDVIRGFRREQVVTTALRLIARRGTLDVSVEEIAAEAGVSRSTIYNHFSDREEILATCAAWTHARLEAAMERVLEADASAEDLLSGFLQAALAALDENPAFYRLTSAYRGGGGPGGVVNEELAAAAPRGRALSERLVRRLAEAGPLRVDEATAASTIGVVLVGALERRAAAPAPRAATDEARVLADVLLHGLSESPGTDR